MEKFVLRDEIHGWVITAEEVSDQNLLVVAVHHLGRTLGFYEAIAGSEDRREFDEARDWVAELPHPADGFVIESSGIQFHLAPDFKNGPQSKLLAIFASVLLTADQLTEAVSEDQTIREETAGNFLNAIAIQGGMWPWEPAALKH